MRDRLLTVTLTIGSVAFLRRVEGSRSDCSNLFDWQVCGDESFLDQNVTNTFLVNFDPDYKILCIT